MKRRFLPHTAPVADRRTPAGDAATAAPALALLSWAASGRDRTGLPRRCPVAMIDKTTNRVSQYEIHDSQGIDRKNSFDDNEKLVDIQTMFERSLKNTWCDPAQGGRKFYDG